MGSHAHEANLIKLGGSKTKAPLHILISSAKYCTSLTSGCQRAREILTRLWHSIQYVLLKKPISVTQAHILSKPTMYLLQPFRPRTPQATELLSDLSTLNHTPQLKSSRVLSPKPLNPITEPNQQTLALMLETAEVPGAWNCV